MKNWHFYQHLDKAFRQERLEDVLDLADQMISSSHIPSHGPGYLLRGVAYEHGSSSVGKDLEKAIDNYRRAALLVPTAMPYIYLARACMKSGMEFYPEAKKHLDEARKLGAPPELDIAYAKYFETSPQPDFVVARKYYARAARAGRFVGFFGYSTVLRKEGRNVAALMVDIVRILAGPLLFLVMGGKASKGHWAE